MTEIISQTNSNTIETREIRPKLDSINNEIFSSLDKFINISKSLESLKNKALEYSKGIKERNQFLEVEYLYNKLPYLYSFRKPVEVFEFIEENPFLISLLKEADWEIPKYFPSDKLILEVITDSEINDKELFILIQTDLEQKEAHHKLNSLDEEWWIDASLYSHNKLCIQVEFR
jgi:hypothetical protein